MPGTMQRQRCPRRGRPCPTPWGIDPHCGAGCTPLLGSQSLMWEALDSANQPPGAKSDYVICSLSIWPAPTSSLLSTHFSPLKWFTDPWKHGQHVHATEAMHADKWGFWSSKTGATPGLEKIYQDNYSLESLFGVPTSPLGSQPASSPWTHLCVPQTPIFFQTAAKFTGECRWEGIWMTALN